MSRPKPLDGVVVVALEQAVAAPFCTARLADAGARVIKIERPEGDFGRGYDDVAKGQSSYFVWVNRGKQSVVLDLAQDDGRRKLRAIIAKADVLVQNFKPGALGRMGMSVETLRAEQPALITCSISGYGDTGPLALRKAYDLLVQAESGLSSITGGPDSPARVGISMVDIATGATAHAAILEALLVRARTGEGADIRIAMFDVMAEWLTVPLLHAEAGKPPKRVGLAHPSIAPYGVFRSSDGGEILISIQSEREWRVLCDAVLAAPEIADDPRFVSNVLRVRHREAADTAVAERFAAWPRDVLVERLNQADIAFAEVNDLDALSRHPHLRRIEVETQNGPVAYPPPAPIVDGRTPAFGPVPAIGEHTDAVLKEFDPS
jgi:formyl-CoA transferase